MRILFDLKGEQQLVEVQKGGSVTSDAEVLWSEDVDGEFPKELLASVGGLERSGKDLIVNRDKLDAYNAQKAAEIAAEAQAKTNLGAAIAQLNAVNLSTTQTTAVLTQTLSSVLIMLRDKLKLLD